MTSYLSPEVTYDIRHRTWTLTECWWCRVDNTVVRVRAGFCFDLASVPRLLWWLLAPNELGIAPALVHDFLYQHQGRITDPAQHRFSRRDVDRIFRQLQQTEGVWWWRRWASWLAVRLFGFFAWRSPDRQGVTPCSSN